MQGVPGMSYKEFLKDKALIDRPTGFEPTDLNPMLFDFQRDIDRWSLRRGRACIFADCGLGKSPMQLVWADAVRKKSGDVLIVAPLAVSKQTVREGNKFGIETEYRRDGEPAKCGITITNYEMMENFSPDDFSGVVLDESSILKSYTGKFRTMIIERFKNTPYRLACTATPAPNDMMELGNHAEFVGAMSRTEMLSMFFVHDGGETQKWRLKGHAKNDFWKWICSWSILLRNPSDLGYSNDGFILPPISLDHVIVHADHTKATGTLFFMEALSLSERQDARRITIDERCQKAAEIANSSDDPCIVWCDRNDESGTLASMINGAVEIRGSDSNEHKENSMMGFSDGSIKKLVTKPSIAGFGMNWQHCNRIIFTGLSDSYEQFYQAIRRCWRFGQKRPVSCHIVTSELEGAVVANIKRKEQQSCEMIEGMLQNMSVYNQESIRGLERNINYYTPTAKLKLPTFSKVI
jgi:superfamily II DNA or RNA helicase